MTLTERISQDVMGAQKAQDKVRLSALRMLRAAIQTVAIEAKADTIDDTAVLQVIRKLVKQRQESIVAFRTGGRQDLVDQETAEMAVLEQYLPAAMAPDELRGIVQAAIQTVGATSAKDFGRVMKQVMVGVAGRADGNTVQRLVQALLPP